MKRKAKTKPKKPSRIVRIEGDISKKNADLLLVAIAKRAKGTLEK